ncbi:hypothetical protein U3516DRAFT_893032 [Neocallimastix sp. 'constans']
MKKIYIYIYIHIFNIINIYYIKNIYIFLIISKNYIVLFISCVGHFIHIHIYNIIIYAI